MRFGGPFVQLRLGALRWRGIAERQAEGVVFRRELDYIAAQCGVPGSIQNRAPAF